MTNFDAELAEPNKWSVEDEVHLLYSTLDNKPVGVDKHFQMSIIWDKFVSTSKKSVNSDIIWKKLNSWYNLKSLDENELLPFNNDEAEFKLPVELIPESFVKSLSEEEKKNVDVSGTHKKYISFTDTEDEDSDSKAPFKLKGNDRVKWFENSQFKATDRARIEIKPRSDNGDSNDSILRKFGDDTENKKVIRQYGKAGEVSSGTIVTLNFPTDHDDNFESLGDASKEDTPDVRNPPQPTELKPINNSDKVVKIKRTRSNKFAKVDPVVSSDAESTGKASPKITQSSEPSPSTATRSRKASVVSEISSSIEPDKTKSPTRLSNDEKSAVKRRFSQRCSSTSESKSDSSVKVDANKLDIKRKCVSRR